MAEITRNLTPDQNYQLMRNQVIAANVGLTNFNEGSDTRALLESVGLIVSIYGNDAIERTRKSIPIALYEGLKFYKKSATQSSGFLRFFRKPIFYITYTGADSSVLLSISSTQLTLTTSSTPADNMTVDFATYPTLDAVVAQIDGHASYAAIKVTDSSLSNLYNYSSVEIVGTLNYLQTNNTRDITDSGAGLITILSGAQASIGDVIIQTTAAGSILAGESTSGQIAAQSVQTGDLADVNISVNAIDTLNGSGTLISSNVGDYVINDSAFANGQAEETETERAERFWTTIQGLHGGTVLGIEADVLKITTIKSCKLIVKYPSNGYNTVVADDGTGSLSVAQIDEIYKTIYGDINDFANYPGKGVAGITYNIQAPTLQVVNFAYTITRVGTITDSTEITNAVQTVIEQYVNTRRLGDDVVLAEIVKRAKASHPAIYDFVLTSPVANVSIADFTIARTGAGVGGTLTPTVVTLTALP